MTKKTLKRVGFKFMMDNVEEIKKQALESVPQIPKEQIPSGRGHRRAFGW
jgi:hypothetical protein